MKGRARTWVRRLARWGAIALVLAFAAFGVAYVRSGNDCDEPHAPLEHPMRAIVHCDYGTADVLRLDQIEKPVPADNQLLVKVRAAAVNPLDWHFIRGTPYAMRLQSGLRKPKSTQSGVDFAGTVEAVGKNVTRFKPGDDVFGGRTGAFADYVCVREDGAVAVKPANVSFEQAAAVPIAGVTALQALRDRGKAGPGTKVLVNGASGGVGTFAVQIAKSLGADVTGVCSGRNVEMVKSLGAARVIDYTKDDFTLGSDKYDLILDNVGNRSTSAIRGVLAPKGTYLLIGGGGPNDGAWLGPLGRAAYVTMLSKFVEQNLAMFLADLNGRDLAALAALMASQQVVPVIDRSYPLAEVPAAVRYLEEGHARGKVVITME